MTWKYDPTKAQASIAAHCRGGRYDRSKRPAENVSEFNMRCLVGMIETGEILRADLVAVGGEELACHVDLACEVLQRAK